MRRWCSLLAVVMVVAACAGQGSSEPTQGPVPTTARPASTTTLMSNSGEETKRSIETLVTATGEPLPNFITDEPRYCGFLGDQIYPMADYEFFVAEHPVIAAVVIGDVDRLDGLLDSGGDPDDLNELYAVTALTLAIQSDCEAAIDLLLEYGADPALAPADGFTPVMWAVKRGNHAILDRLINAGADIDVVRHHLEGASAVRFAVDEMDRDALEILISAGADLDPETRRTTPLESAVAAGWVDGVELLVEAGADTTTAAFRLIDPDNRDLELLRYLLDHGASPVYLPEWANEPGGPCLGHDTLTSCFEASWPEGAAVLHEYDE